MQAESNGGSFYIGKGVTEETVAAANESFGASLKAGIQWVKLRLIKLPKNTIYLTIPMGS